MHEMATNELHQSWTFCGLALVIFKVMAECYDQPWTFFP